VKTESGTSGDQPAGTAAENPRRAPRLALGRLRALWRARPAGQERGLAGGETFGEAGEAAGDVLEPVPEQHDDGRRQTPRVAAHGQRPAEAVDDASQTFGRVEEGAGRHERNRNMAPATWATGVSGGIRSDDGW
jgi:hypothetical protein